MALFQFSWFPDFYKSIDELKTISMNENWDYTKNPTGKNPILVNYIHHTFDKIQNEGKIETDGEFACFNTGLVTENQEEIYGYFQVNKKPSTTIPYYFIGWRKSSHRDLSKFSKLAEIMVSNPRMQIAFSFYVGQRRTGCQKDDGTLKVMRQEFEF
jgi:hypothetical protein